jgi:subtilisin family serine protease
VTGAGQVIGAGDTGADRRNCYLAGSDKFAMYRSIVDGDAVDDDGHGTHVCGSLAGLTRLISYSTGAATPPTIVHRCSLSMSSTTSLDEASMSMMWPCSAAGNGGDGSANGGAKDAQIAFTAGSVGLSTPSLTVCSSCSGVPAPHPPSAAYLLVPFSA